MGLLLLNLRKYLPLQLADRSHAQDEPNALFDLAQGRGGESADPLVEEAPIERRDLRHVDDRARGQAARSAHHRSPR